MLSCNSQLRSLLYEGNSLLSLGNLGDTEGFGESRFVDGGFKGLGVANDLLLFNLDAFFLLDNLHLDLLVLDELFLLRGLLDGEKKEEKKTLDMLPLRFCKSMATLTIGIILPWFRLICQKLAGLCAI